jgi:hypothetical protein
MGSKQDAHRPGGTGDPDRSNIMSKTLDTTCGIYNTEYTLTKHRDGGCTVNAPYINWKDGSGVLSFKNISIKPVQAKDVIWFFENDTTYNDATGLTLDAEIHNPN